MRGKPFEVLWEAMEARRRQIEAGEVPLAYRLEHRCQEERRDRGCPDVEALCGWVDGELRRNSLRRWLTVWQHVRLHGKTLHRPAGLWQISCACRFLQPSSV